MLGGGGIERLLTSLEATSEEIRGLVAENRATVGSTVRNFDAASATLARELPRLAGQMERAMTQIAQLVEANRGNVDAPAQVLSLELLSPDGGENRTVDVPELSPGGQSTVKIQDLVVVPGQTYQLGVALNLNIADGDPTNNAISLTFLVNEATG